jgi:hypothetical protein
MPEINIATRECVVYWLYDEKCVCPWKHGYVGITFYWKRRIARHRQFFNFAFDCKILFRGSRGACLKLEWQMRPCRGIGWNCAAGGALVRLGHRASAEAKRNMSEAAKRRAPMSEETKAKLRARDPGIFTNKSRLGQKKSDVERAKISASNAGKVRADPQCNARFGNTSHLGYKHSEETKRIISTKKIGVPIHSDEEREKRRQRMKGNALTKGKPWSAARRLTWLSRQPKSTP